MGNVRMRAEQINYGASNVKVALDDLDPKDLIALSARMDTIEAWKATVKTEEKTGASVEFTNALALPAVSLSAEIEASQDLHGYDKPWVGGAYKNQFNKDTAVVGYVKSADGTISENADYKASDYIPVVAGQDYTISGTDFSGGNSGAFYDSNKDFISGIVTSPFTVTAPDNAVYMRITMLAGSIGTAQVEKGSSATSYAPYSNICPISGHTSVTITDYDSESNTASVTIQLGTTVYGGTLNVTTGELTITHANIASYNGETIGEPWISSMDEYTEGGTPTTGAQVVYTLATPTTIQLTPTQLTMLKGYNRLSSDGGGDITVKAYTGAPWGGDEA